jgi:hypothetical protein
MCVLHAVHRLLERGVHLELLLCVEIFALAQHIELTVLLLSQHCVYMTALAPLERVTPRLRVCIHHLLGVIDLRIRREESRGGGGGDDGDAMVAMCPTLRVDLRDCLILFFSLRGGGGPKGWRLYVAK